MKPLRYGSRLVWIFAPAAMAAAILALSFMITPAKPSTERKAVWDAHNALCLQTPLSLYSRDRARLVRGTILDPAGLPVAGADVRCLNSKGLERLLRMGPKLLREWESSDWAEARTVTNAEGVFEFPHLPEGSRMFCFSKPGFAPVTRGLIPVQDGLGARIDATLSKPKQLRLRWSRPQSEIRRIALIPYRWSPAPRIADIQPDATSATFSDLGGPFRKVAVLGLRSNDEENPRVLKIVDLDQTQDADLGDLKLPPSANTDVSIVLDEAEDLETWAKAPAEAHRVFYGMLNPWAAFWREFPSNHRPPRSLTASMPKPATSSSPPDSSTCWWCRARRWRP